MTPWTALPWTSARTDDHRRPIGCAVAPDRCARTLDVELVHRGKVRDVYSDRPGELILVASDRVSVYDVVLPTPIPDRGKILTALSLWWFDQLQDIVA